MSTIDEEIKFLVDAHEKAVAKRTTNKAFLERCKLLFLSGDISDRALFAARIMYDDSKKPSAELIQDIAAMQGLNTMRMAPAYKPPSSSSSSGCGGGSSSSSSGCGSSSNSRSSC